MGWMVNILHHGLYPFHHAMHMIHWIWMHSTYAFSHSYGVLNFFKYVPQRAWAQITSVQAVTTSANILWLMMISVVLIVSLAIFATGRKILLALSLFFVVAAMADLVSASGSFYYNILGFCYILVLLAALHIFLVGGDLSYEVNLLYRILDMINLDGGLNQYSSNLLKERQQSRRKKKYQRRTVATWSQEEVEEEAARFKRLIDRCEKAHILAYPLDQEEDLDPEADVAPQLESSAPPNSLEERIYVPENTAKFTARDFDLGMRSGRYLLQWLAREIHESEGFVVPVKWSQDRKTGKIECYNGYNNVNRPVGKDFFVNSDDMIIGSVSVMRPTEIQPALRLIDTALDYVKFYDSSKFEVAGGESLTSHSQFRRFIAVKCEFKRYPAEFKHDSERQLDVDNPNWIDDRKHEKYREEANKNNRNNRSREPKGVYVQKDRELVNLLTVSVDRFLVVTFHLGYMLQYPTPQTCQELEILFGELIFNKGFIKIWQNVPESVSALDATLEHIFRGRFPRTKSAPDYQVALKRYKSSLRKPFRETKNSPLRYPHYKDTGPNTYLNVNRPASLEFERSRKPCPLGLHGPGVDYAGRRCPCYLGILDITSVLDFILRQHCFIPGESTASTKKFASDSAIWPALSSWEEPRKDCDFPKLAQWMLAGSKYQPLLCRFKARSHTKPEKPNITGLQGIGAKEAMNVYNMQVAIYKEKASRLSTPFGETDGIERDETCLSYIVGDAIGLALIFRYLLTSESSRLVAERLCHYGYREPLKIEPFAYETALYRPPLEPLSIPPLIQKSSHTIGLEVDVRDEDDEEEYIIDEIYTKLANRPWWYMKRDTHWKAQENYGRVIAVSFQRTGWEFPVPLESERIDVPSEGNYNEPIGCRNLAARIFRNNFENLPRDLRMILGRAAYLSNGVWFSAFACLLEWHCGLISLNLPQEDLAVIYHDEDPIPAEVNFRREFSEHVRNTGTRPAPTQRDRNPPVSIPQPLRPAPRQIPATPPRPRVPTGNTPTPSPKQKPYWYVGMRRVLESDPELPPLTLWQYLRGFWMSTQPQDPPQPILDGPPEGYVIRTSRTTGRLYWWNRERNISLWPDRPAALAAERRAADATAAAEQAVADANEDVTRAVTAESNAKASATRAAITADNIMETGAVVVREMAIYGATASQRAANEATHQVAAARAAADTARWEANHTLAALRVGDAVAAEDAAQRAANAANAARTAADAAVRGATDAAHAAQQGLGATSSPAAAAAAVATAAAFSARRTADATRQTAEFQKLQANTAVENQQAMYALAESQLIAVANTPQMADVATRFASCSISLTSEDETPAPVVASWTTNRWAATIARRAREAAAAAGQMATDASESSNPDPAAQLAAAAAVDAANAAAVRAAQRARAIYNATAVFDGQLDQTVSRLSASVNSGYDADVDTDPINSATISIASASLGIASIERVLLPTLDADRQAQLAIEVAQRAEDIAIAAERIADEADEALAVANAAAAAGRVAEGLRLPLYLTSRSILVPIPAQHELVDGVCAEILIFMLVQEISQYEELDSDRRMFLGFEKMEQDYNAFVGSSLRDHAAVKLLLREAGLSDGSHGRLSYKEPYWFKRLQVLLGHEFACCTAFNRSNRKICQQCGAKDRYALLEMLIAELERIKKLATAQIKLKDAYSRIYQEARQKMWIWGRLQSPQVLKPTPSHKSETSWFGSNLIVIIMSWWAHLIGLWNLGAPPGTNPAAPPAAISRTQRENEWIMPPWCKCLLRIPLNKDREYPKPSVRRLHRDLLQATIVLLHVNPQTGPDTWKCLQKWWGQGLRVQATGLADENVHQFDLPNLAQVTADNPEPMPNFGINMVAVNARRSANPENRELITRAANADHMISVIAARNRRAARGRS